MMRLSVNPIVRSRFFVALFALALPPLSASAEGTQETQTGGTGQASAAAADSAKACPDGALCGQETPAAPVVRERSEQAEPAGELVGLVRDEGGRGLLDAFRYGLEGFRQGDKAQVEGTLEMIHEQYGLVPIIDEARLLVSVPSMMFGRRFQVGMAAWRDLTIDARSRVVGPELAWQGFNGLELTAGAYIGNINIEENSGRFVMARVEAERDFGDLELLVNLELGRIHRNGDSRLLGNGPYHKYEAEAVVPFARIPGLRGIPGSLALSVEFKRTTFSGGGPDDHEVTKIVGYEFPLTAVATKIGRALSHTTAER